jgi:predicted ATPase
LRFCLILDPPPLHLEGARIDHDVDTVLFDEAIVHDDSALGYDEVRVPVLPPHERLEFVLDRLFNPGPL